VNRSPSSLPFSRIAENLIEKMPNRPDYREIFFNWENIVGEYIASVCTVHKAINMGKNKVLVLKTRKGCGPEILHEGGKILDAVNNFLKKKTFSQIKIFQTDDFGCEK
jgi:hypothetical protein